MKELTKQTHSSNGSLHSTEVAYLPLTQQPRAQFLAFPKTYFNVAEIYLQHWLEENGQRLENVYPTHLLAPASGKLLLQKHLPNDQMAEQSPSGLA